MRGIKWGYGGVQHDRSRGTVGTAEFSIAGSGTVRAFDCTMDELECKIAGSGDIEASVVNKIKAEIAGSGSVKYKGDPQDIQKR